MKIVFLLLVMSPVFCKLPRIKVRFDGHFIDDTGRVRLFHGFNAVNKAFPWYPPHMSNVSLVKHYKEWGFNAVRLGTMWSGVEPSMGSYNDTYLGIIRSQVDNLADSGLYAFLDMHQDVLSEKFGTYNGAPSWLVDLLPEATNPYPWPWKSTKPFDGSGWGLQYLTEGCSAAFQGLYDNVNHSQDKFIAFWKKVALTFKDVTSVLGYELINEPWAGNIYNDPLLFVPGHAGEKNLMPMYDKVARAIRSVDNDTIIMYEPVTWGIWFNGKFGTGFETVPGGPEYRDRSVLSYHLYCWLKGGDGEPLTLLDRVVCDDILAADVMANAVREFRRTGGGGFLTEFGECEPDGRANSSNTVLCETVLNLADKHLASWTYWDRDFFDGDGNIEWDILKPFVRAYPTSTAGTPLHLSWDDVTSSLTLHFLLDPEIPLPTEIFIPPLKYSSGVVVAVSDTVTYKVDLGENVVRVYRRETTREQVVVKVFITPRDSGVTS